MTAQFVILTHDSPDLHWDFMLEQETALRTWRLMQKPVPGREVDALEIPAHRKHYLDYEGPVSGDRGTVTRWEHGIYEMIEETPEQIKIELNGQRLQVLAILVPQNGDRWRFQFFDSAPDDS